MIGELFFSFVFLSETNDASPVQLLWNIKHQPEDLLLAIFLYRSQKYLISLDCDTRTRKSGNNISFKFDKKNYGA